MTGNNGLAAYCDNVVKSGFGNVRHIKQNSNLLRPHDEVTPCICETAASGKRRSAVAVLKIPRRVNTSHAERIRPLKRCELFGALNGDESSDLSLRRCQINIVGGKAKPHNIAVCAKLRIEAHKHLLGRSLRLMLDLRANGKHLCAR